MSAAGGGPSRLEAVTSGGELVAVAWRCADRDTWILRVRGVDGAEFVEGEQATRDRLAELAAGAAPAPITHPAWCDPALCGRTADRPNGAHQSAATVMQVRPSPLGVRVELSLISAPYGVRPAPGGPEVVHVDFTVALDPDIETGEPIEPYGMPLSPAAALDLARALEAIVAASGVIT